MLSSYHQRGLGSQFLAVIGLLISFLTFSLADEVLKRTSSYTFNEAVLSSLHSGLSESELSTLLSESKAAPSYDTYLKSVQSSGPDDLKRNLRVAVVTDTHIGEGCGGNLSIDKCKPVKTLIDAVNQINQMTPKIDAVFVTGDITSSALKEEFQKAKEVLDLLTVPYFPVLGNHDSWPYTHHSDGTFNQTDTPIGDEYFMQQWGDILSGKKYTGPTAPKVTRWPGSSCLNGDYPTFNSWFHNYVVSFPGMPGLKMLALDWVSRGAALPEAGVGPEAELHDFPCGTLEWLSQTLKDIRGEEDSNTKFFLMQHHPFHSRDAWDPFGREFFYNFTFDNHQDARVQQVLGQYWNSSAFLGVQAGHIHRWYDGTAFTKYTAIDDTWRGLKEWETSACKGWWADSDFVSAIQIFTFTQESGTSDAASSSSSSSAAGGVFLSDVHGLWKLPSGKWVVKPVKEKRI